MIITNSNVFMHCRSLTSLNISGWKVSDPLTIIDDILFWCDALKILNLSNWDTGMITDMYAIFSGCSSLTSLDMSGWNTSNVTNMSYMFRNCSSLSSIIYGTGWDTASGRSDMFTNCPANKPPDW